MLLGQRNEDLSVLYSSDKREGKHIAVDRYGRLIVTDGPSTPGHIVSAATTNATAVKSGRGEVAYIFASNSGTEEVYLKIHDVAGVPVPGTTAVVHTIIIPGNTTGSGNNLVPFGGIDLTTGIGFSITAGIADSDATAIAANEVVVNYGYR